MKNKFIILLLILSFLLLVGCNTPVASNITTIDIELDSIEIEVISSAITNKIIITNPNNIKFLKEKDKIDFICQVYNEGELLSDVVTCVASNVPQKCYELTPITNGYSLKIKAQYNKPLILTFSASGCADYVMPIKLIGLL